MERPCGLPGGFLLARLDFPGRIWAQFLCLSFEGFVLLASVAWTTLSTGLSF